MLDITGSVTGSSPRLRGTQLHQFLLYFQIRFIPALAGNTPRILTPTLSASVHPRACGEHPFHSLPFLTVLGSSPRLRGTLTNVSDPMQRQRFIPALAGNTFLAATW